MTNRIVLSFGGGVQSSTIALMAERGELPKPECAVFADTGNEPQTVYNWINWIEKQLSFPIVRLYKKKKDGSQDNLGDASLIVRTAKSGNKYTKHSIPFYTKDNFDGSSGFMVRQCTADFKITPIQQYIRSIRGKSIIHQWLGISKDEASRMRDSKLSYVVNSYPLIEKNMSRNDCLDWMKINGFPEPPRSACIFCPFKSAKEWLRIKGNVPEFDKVIEYEIKLQQTMSKIPNFRSTPYLHKSLKPISEVDFRDSNYNLFENECEGVCGV